jgi:serine phosphatase RsbU (regulator of sigma subunit)
VSGDMVLRASRVGMDTARAVRDDAERHAVGLVRACLEWMSQEPDEEDAQLRRLHSEADARKVEFRPRGEWEHRQDALIARLRREAEVRDEELSALRERLGAAEHELEDLRAIRDALTPPELPQRPGLELAAAFVPAAEQVSGDFYLVAEGPQDSTLLVVGDVIGHGLRSRAAGSVRSDRVCRDRPFLG